jgi:hypothetical protein
MSLSAHLQHVDLTLECKYCGHPLIKKGGWFVVVHRFKCEGCNRETPITYNDKIVLFKKHEDLIAIQVEIERSLAAAAIGCAQDRNREKSDRPLRAAIAKAPRLVGYAGMPGAGTYTISIVERSASASQSAASYGRARIGRNAEADDKRPVRRCVRWPFLPDRRRGLIYLAHRASASRSTRTPTRREFRSRSHKVSVRKRKGCASEPACGAAALSGQTISETGADALVLEQAQSFAATISGFGTGDTIDATNFVETGTKYNFVENSAMTGGTLTLTDTSQSLTANIQMTGEYSKSDFILAPDSGTGTLVKFV